MFCLLRRCFAGRWVLAGVVGLAACDTPVTTVEIDNLYAPGVTG